ncbi:TPA: hypothetical protein ACHVE4_000470 [Streptococcus suis]
MNINSDKLIDLPHKDIDFLNIDTTRDTKLFLDPTKLFSTKLDRIFQNASLKVESFFQEALRLYESKQLDDLEELFNHSQECNQTHLGHSKGASRGTGASKKMLMKFFEQVINSDDESKKRLLSLTAMTIFSPRFAEDRSSDLLTNILKKEIIEYTLKQAKIHNIQIIEDNKSFGYYWSDKELKWKKISSFYILGRDNKPLLLLPKQIISKKYYFSVEKFVKAIIFPKYREKFAGQLGKYKNGNNKPISDKYLIQKLISEPYESNKWKEFANDELAKTPRLFINFYDREINNLEFSVRQLSDDELDDLTK